MCGGGGEEVEDPAPDPAIPTGCFGGHSLNQYIFVLPHKYNIKNVWVIILKLIYSKSIWQVLYLAGSSSGIRSGRLAGPGGRRTCTGRGLRCDP